MKEEKIKYLKNLLEQKNIEPTPERIKAMQTLLALATLCVDLQESTAAIGAYEIIQTGEVCLPESISDYINRLHVISTQYYLMEISTFFDKEKIYKSENCSLPMLKALCLMDKECFPNGEQDPIIQQIQTAIENYKNSPIHYSRNKQLGHHDFEQTINGTAIRISYEDAASIVMDIQNIIQSVLNIYTLDMTPPFISVKDRKLQFQNSLKVMENLSLTAELLNDIIIKKHRKRRIPIWPL